jgi:restriction system protein
VQWALTYLRQAGLVETAGRGISQITPQGLHYLPRAPAAITPDDLMEFPEFVAFKQRTSRPPESGPGVVEQSAGTPEETIAAAYKEHSAALAEEVLVAVKAMSPARFERLIVDLMLAMGYGGTEDAGRVLGRSGDEGVDGVIDQDKLGLDKIYLQAKKWTDAPVGRKDVQAFVGALSGQGAAKGVFITSSTFSQGAQEYARANKSFSISLVDGIELARLMIAHGLGVAVQETYVLKRVDSDFFTGD